MSRQKPSRISGEVLHVSKRVARSGSWAHEIVIADRKYILYSESEYCFVRIGDHIAFSYEVRHPRHHRYSKYNRIVPDSIELLAVQQRVDNQGGYVYVLTNSAMPGLVKIGYTVRCPYERARELSRATSVPTHFEVAGAVLINGDASLIERATHCDLRASRSGKEFFRLKPEAALSAISRIYANTYPVAAAAASAELRERVEELERRRSQDLARLAAEHARKEYERSPRYRWLQNGYAITIVRDFGKRPADCSFGDFDEVISVRDTRSLWTRLKKVQIGPEWVQVKIAGRPGYNNTEPTWSVDTTGMVGGKRVVGLNVSTPQVNDALEAALKHTRLCAENYRLQVMVAASLLENADIVSDDDVIEKRHRLYVQRKAMFLGHMVLRENCSPETARRQ